MRIIKVINRVANQEYLVEVDLKTDITKYGDENTFVPISSRFKKQVFSIEQLELAENFKLFINDFYNADSKWWKDAITPNLGHIKHNIKGYVRVFKLFVKKMV